MPEVKTEPFSYNTVKESVASGGDTALELYEGQSLQNFLAFHAGWLRGTGRVGGCSRN